MMSDYEGCATASSIPRAVLPDRRYPAPFPTSVDATKSNNGSCPDLQADVPNTVKEWESFERPSRRPSFLDNLADSRESQFHVQDRSELERYFVCDILLAHELLQAKSKTSANSMVLGI